MKSCKMLRVIILNAGFYYIEYTLQNPGESRKHLFSAIGMASNGWYNRLYTVTGQVHSNILELLFFSCCNPFMS